jgi:hypothetical protein
MFYEGGPVRMSCFMPLLQDAILSHLFREVEPGEASHCEGSSGEGSPSSSSGAPPSPFEAAVAAGQPGVAPLAGGSPRGAPRMDAILRTALEVAEGMAYLQARSIVHGDLTGANILLQSKPVRVATYPAVLQALACGSPIMRVPCCCSMHARRRCMLCAG